MLEKILKLMKVSIWLNKKKFYQKMKTLIKSLNKLLISNKKKSRKLKMNMKNIFLNLKRNKKTLRIKWFKLLYNLKN